MQKTIASHLAVATAAAFLLAPMQAQAEQAATDTSAHTMTTRIPTTMMTAISTKAISTTTRSKTARFRIGAATGSRSTRCCRTERSTR